MPSFWNVLKIAVAVGALALIAFGGAPQAVDPPNFAVANADGGLTTPDSTPVAVPDSGGGANPKPPEPQADDLDPAIFGGAKTPQAFANLEASLDAVADSVQDGQAAVLDAVGAAPLSQGDAVAVSVYADSDISDAKTFLETNGVSIDYAGADWLEAYVPASLLRALSQRNDVIRVAPLIPAVPDQTATACAIIDLGAVDADGASTTGQWVDGCDSIDRANTRAQFYTFSTAARALLDIDLVSSVDAYINVRAGAVNTGAIIAYDDDSGVGRNARVSSELAAGTYTIEATTKATNQTGAFTLRIGYTAAAACSIGSIDAVDDANTATITENEASGTWAASCVSAARAGSHSAYYSFIPLTTGNYLINLTHTDDPATADPYLYLRPGNKTVGQVFTPHTVSPSFRIPAEDDDSGDGTDAQILAYLTAGAYTIEAATANAAETGGFTLSILALNERHQNNAGKLGADGTIRGNLDIGRSQQRHVHRNRIPLPQRQIRQVLHVRSPGGGDAHARHDRPQQQHGPVPRNRGRDARRSRPHGVPARHRRRPDERRQP